jgi:outer membrane protein assembly factor BamB
VVRPLALLCALPAVAPAADWPHWLGPTRDGVWAETGVLESLPPGGPRKLWGVPVGGGYSGPAVVAGRVYVLDYQKASGEAINSPARAAELTGQERVVCLDAKTGKELWVHAYDCPYKVSYPAGPRCTPTVAGGAVFALGAMGNLVALDADTGAVKWKADFKTAFGAKTPIWGFSGHPLALGSQLVCTVGGPDALLVAFDQGTGKVVWAAGATGGDGPGYGPPVPVAVGGRTQIVHWNPKAVVGYDPASGKSLWRVPLEPAYGMSIAAPQVQGDTLFVGGYTSAALAVKLSSGGPAELWRGQKKTGLYPVNATPLVRDGVIYGSDANGHFRAVELATGRRLWGTTAPALGAEKEENDPSAKDATAFAVTNGDRAFLFNELGELVVAKLTPHKYEEVSRAKLVDATGEAFGRKVVWAMPAFADKCVFVRNDREVACFSLAKE